MAIRNIVKFGDDVLQKKCRPIEKIDDKILTLIQDMKETLALSQGVGLAAPQVGMLKRLCIIDVGNGPMVLINPEIIKTEGSQTDTEGCLSYPGKWGLVTRPYRVIAKAQDEKGQWRKIKGEGLLARALCHEIDHLDGHMFMEKVSEWIETEQENIYENIIYGNT